MAGSVCKERLREPGLLSQEKRRLWGSDPCVEIPDGKEWGTDRLFSVMPNKTRGDRHRLKYGRFCLNLGKQLFSL